jgi:hypothetical protein
MRLAVEKIVIDPNIYPRRKVNQFHVAKLRAAFQAGAKFPPLTVEHTTHRLVDGRHRRDVYVAEGVATIDVTTKHYASEADLFADAVRLNVGHGEALDQYCVRNSIIRLLEYGFTREIITDIVRLPAARIEEIERGFAFNESDNKPIALKGGLDHLKGAHLDQGQMEVNRHYSGGKAVFYVRQICDLLQNDMWPVTSTTFPAEMDRLVRLWAAIKRGQDGKAA